MGGPMETGRTRARARRLGRRPRADQKEIDWAFPFCYVSPLSILTAGDFAQTIGGEGLSPCQMTDQTMKEIGWG